VGISILKSLKNCEIIFETNSKEQLQSMGKDINAKCVGDLEPNIHTPKKNLLTILNILQDFSTTNIEDKILAKNPDLKLRNGDIVAKFSYKTKKQIRNLLMGVGSQTRKLLETRRLN